MDRSELDYSENYGGISKSTIISRKDDPRRDLQPKPSDDTVAQTKNEEWTTSRKVVNHKTKQVETRVQRQIVMEDGKVIADSGPLVTTKTKEDNKKEESENTHHKHLGDADVPPGPGYVAVPGSNQVVDEKTETHQTMREAKEESLQYHDESFRELTGYDVHRKALAAPNELITINADSNDPSQPPRGKLTHYSSKSNKINDSEEVKETSRLGRDGTIATETTRTHHHEEFNDDELPEDKIESALPEASTETTRKIEYLKDYEGVSDRFSDNMHRRNKHVYAVEERPQSGQSQIREKTTRWLDDHFGSDESDIIETSPERSRGNVIHIDMTDRRSTPTESRHSTLKSDSHKKKGTYKSTATYYVKDSASPSPRSSPYPKDDYRTDVKFADYSQRRQKKETRYERDSKYKEDASVQAAFSDDDADIEISNVYRSKGDKYQSGPKSTSSQPSNTFYFGDKKDREYRSTPEYKNIVNNQTHQLIERDNKLANSFDRNFYGNYGSMPQSVSEWKDGGYVSSNVQKRETSTKHYSDVTNGRKDTDKNLDQSWPEHTYFGDTPKWSDSKISSPNEYIHHPIINGSNRRDPSSRQRSSETFYSPPPPLSSPIQDRYTPDYYRYRRTPSPSPPSSPSGGTWTKSKGRRLAPLYRSSSPPNIDNFPDFTPLLSPSEIKNISFNNK